MSVKSKNNFLLLFLLMVTGLCFSQGGFKKKYFLSNSLTNISLDAIEKPNGDLIMIGLTVDSMNNRNFNHLSIVGTNAQGIQLWRKDYGDSKFQYLENPLITRAVIKDNSGFYYTGVILDSTGSYYSVLIKFNYNGDTLWQKSYRDTNYYLSSQSVAKSVDGGFLLAGFFQATNGNDQPLLLLKTDSNGNELWRKKLQSSNTAWPVWSGYRSIEDSLTKKIVIVGYQYTGPNIIQSLVLTTDSLGVVLFKTSIANPGSSIFPDVIQTQDKNFVSCGNQNQYSPIGANNRTKILMIKFDITGSLIWSKVFDTLSMYNGAGVLKELSDGDLVIGAGFDTMSNYGYSPVVHIELIRTDKNGNLKWKGFVGDSYSTTNSEYIKSLNPTYDGGFLIASWLPYYPSPSPFRLIKIDSTGCDTLEAYCKSLALGLTGYDKPAGFEFNVFPNPAKDRIYVKADFPANRVAILRIADVSGREIEQRVLDPGKNYEINTSAYAGGVFLVSFIYESRVLETRRLVILK